MCGEVLKRATTMPDEPKGLVWVCGEVWWVTMTCGKQKITPNEPKRLVWMCGEVRQATTTQSPCEKKN
jgi:hypothetical protein